MKKSTFLLLVVGLLVFSCTKESATDCKPAEGISLDGSAKITGGAFSYSSSKNPGGFAKIYRLKNGKYVLALEQMNLSSDFDLEIFFSKTASVSDGSLKLFSGKTFNGNVYYEIPSGINIADFKFVVIQNDLMEEALASAELS